MYIGFAENLEVAGASGEVGNELDRFGPWAAKLEEWYQGCLDSGSCCLILYSTNASTRLAKDLHTRILAVLGAKTCLDFGEYRRDGVELFCLGKQRRESRFVLDQRASVDNEAVDALLLGRVGRRGGVGLGSHGGGRDVGVLQMTPKSDKLLSRPDNVLYGNSNVEIERSKNSWRWNCMCCSRLCAAEVEFGLRPPHLEKSSYRYRYLGT